MTERIKGSLEIDKERGVVYFHAEEGPMRGVSKLRVSGVIIPGNDSLIDVTSIDHPEFKPRFDLAKFSEVNLQRCTSPDGFNHSLESWSEAEWTNAMAGELGEAANLTKKLLRHRDNVAGNNKAEDKNVASLKERAAHEIADAMVYGDLAIQRLGFDASTMIRDVFNAKSDELGCNIRFEED